MPGIKRLLHNINFGPLLWPQILQGVCKFGDVTFLSAPSPLKMAGIRNLKFVSAHFEKWTLKGWFFCRHLWKNYFSEGSKFCQLLWRKKSEPLILNPTILGGGSGGGGGGTVKVWPVFFEDKSQLTSSVNGGILSGMLLNMMKIPWKVHSVKSNFSIASHLSEK